MPRKALLAALAAALALWPRPSWTQEEDPPPAAPAGGAYRSFTSARRTFACDVPVRGWRVFEEETPSGSAAHFLGPSELDGSWRAALHVHYVDKTQPGFLPLEDAVKRARRAEPGSSRSATTVRRWRVARQSARRFEVTETRLIPPDRLPAAPAVLHHYVAFVPAGDGYFLVKLSSARDNYLDYRELFERVLQTFRILGYP
ncbi:MAG: hypothetical protein HY554_18240 [Elusimicrobia bacterium]|nr:hypothetical protein [Elusimicrobiota bacterium]